jgi:DNA mismatch repair ATPase MutS
MNNSMEAVIEELKKCFEEIENLEAEGHPRARQLYDEMLDELDKKIKELKAK